MSCVVLDQRPQRGPKKGQLDEMRTRIAVLEWQLGKQLENHRDPNVSSTDLGPKLPAAPVSGDARSNSSTPGIIPSVPPEDQNNTHISRRTSESTHQNPISVTSAGGEPLSTPASTIFPVPTSTDAAATPTLALVASTENAGLPTWIDWQNVDMDGGVMLADMQFDLEPPSPHRIIGGFEMTKLVMADLKQLYFDRVHAFLPMIHRWRYFSWAYQEKPSPAQACLRSAIHTVAAAMSAQYRSLGDTLYQETRGLLESQRTRANTRNNSSEASWLTSSSFSPSPCTGDKIPLELVQAWLLLAHYEFLRIDEHQSMLTAGRAFRLVQLARLYDVDGGAEDMSPTYVGAENGGDRPEESLALIEAEESRRTFWLAFSLDRFLCSRNEWPLTLQEEVVRTRLPAPETSFQNSQPTRVCFLSEALAMTATQYDSSMIVPLSPFAECIVLAALHGRCMTHRRVSLASARTAEGQDFWTRYDWLASAVEKRAQLLAQSPPNKTVDRDPMTLFTHMLAHKAVIYLSSTLETAPHKQQQQASGLQLSAASSKWRAERAAGEMVRLAESARSLGCFGVHPFTADPLACAADFFIRETESRGSRSPSEMGNNSSGSGSGSTDGDVESLLSVLRNLRDVNNLARDYLSTLEADYSSWCAGGQRER